MLNSWLTRLTNLDEAELKPALLSCAYFFFILSGYYILRPLREEMGLAGGVHNLPRLYLINLGVMLAAAPLFGVLASRFTRRIFIPVTYYFFMANLLIFWVLMRLLPAGANITLGRVFYVWISVFNMWAVSLFWAFMADGYGLDRSKRVFGFIATGGTLGAIVGAGITAHFVAQVGRVNLLLISVVLLQLAIFCVQLLARYFDTEATSPSHRKALPVPVGGHPFSGIFDTFGSQYLLAISAYLMLYALGSTFLYFEQANIVAAHVTDRSLRAALFARIDLWVNSLTLLVQVFFAGRIIRRIGVAGALVLLPLLSVIGFLALGKASILPVLVVFQVVRRAANYSLMRPARETLFTVVPPAQKYKAKSFIDTFVYRGGDVLGASFFDVLTRLGLGLGGIAFVAVPFAMLWGATGLFLGRHQNKLAAIEGPRQT